MADAEIQHIYDDDTGSLSYIVGDPITKRAAVIDPVLGFSAVSGRIDKSIALQIIERLRAGGWSLEWILETHAHADHLTAAQILKKEMGGSVGIGHGIRRVQAHFAEVFNLSGAVDADGDAFDRLFAGGDTFAIGQLECRVMDTPGHTNDSVTYLIGDAAFIGDSLFMFDYGTARCDFPGGDASQLYDSIQKLYSLPDDTRLLMCHDYPPQGRGVRFECTVAEQRRSNVHVADGVSKQEFVETRRQRDATLELPHLIIPSIQVNIRAGHLPDPEDNQVTYLKIPLDTL